MSNHSRRSLRWLLPSLTDLSLTTVSDIGEQSLLSLLPVAHHILTKTENNKFN